MKPELEKLKDENGQVPFYAAVYFDDETTVADKRFWLEHCAKELTGAEQKEAQKYLDRFTAELGNEFQR